eukprot:Awhi_evm1s9862
MVNVALGKLATASSVLLGYEATHVTNGIINDIFKSYHSLNENGLHWVEVDLGSTFTISEIQIYNRAHARQRIIGFYVHLLNEAKEIVSEYSYDDWGQVLTQYNKRFDVYVTARYVKVLKEVDAVAQTPLQVQEIVVHA